MPNTDLPPQEEYSYSMPPAAQINLNINLTELPKCPKAGCDGHFLPLQWTSNPKSGVNAIYVAAWCCTGCGANVMYSNGKLYMQPTLIETNQTL